jgi:hypothetical protein
MALFACGAEGRASHDTDERWQLLPHRSRIPFADVEAEASIWNEHDSIDGEGCMTEEVSFDADLMGVARR